jgi:hypothetical protein
MSECLHREVNRVVRISPGSTVPDEVEWMCLGCGETFVPSKQLQAALEDNKALREALTLAHDELAHANSNPGTRAEVDTVVVAALRAGKEVKP